MSRDPKEAAVKLKATVGVAENAASVGRSTMGSQAYEPECADVYIVTCTAELFAGFLEHFP
jgi:lipid-binding SYLF domain-containing protein